MNKFKLENYNLFSSDNMDLISELLDTKIDSLRNIKRYKELEKEMFELSDSIYNSLPDNKKEKLEKLTFILGEMEAYSNTLLYALGIKFGIDIGKL